MKVIFELPKIERMWLSRNPDLKVHKTTKWLKVPKKKGQWWKIGGSYSIYFDCYLGTGCPFRGCYYSDRLGKWRHKETYRSSSHYYSYYNQQQGLCIERNLTSWIFRWRYEGNLPIVFSLLQLL